MTPPRKPVTPELEAAAKAAGVNLDDEVGLSEDFFETDDDGVEEEIEDIESSDPPETPTDPTLDDFPENWFGHNVRAFAEQHGVEAATEFFNTLKEQDRAANRRLQELAEIRKQEEEERRKVRPTRAEPEAEETQSDLSDEELLQIAGISTDILEYDDFGKPVAQLVKLVLDAQNKLEDFAKQSESQAWEQNFFNDFDRLQETHGQLPYDRGTIEDYAIERGIFDPEALYWVMAGPVRSQTPAPKASDSPEMRRLKKQVSGTKRRGAAKGSVTPGKPKTMKEAFEMAKQKHGIADDTDPFAD